MKYGARTESSNITGTAEQVRQTRCQSIFYPLHILSGMVDSTYYISPG